MRRAPGELAADTDAAFDLQPTPSGSLLVGLNPAGPRRMAADLAVLWPELEPVFLDGDPLQRLEPGLAAGVSACRLAIGYPVPPAAATRAYARLAQQRGAVIRVGSPVATLLLEAGRAVGRGPWPTEPRSGRAPCSSRQVRGRRRWSIHPVDGVHLPRGVVVEVGLPDPPGHVLEEAEIAIRNLYQ